MEKEKEVRPPSRECRIPNKARGLQGGSKFPCGYLSYFFGLCAEEKNLALTSAWNLRGLARLVSHASLHYR